MKTVHGETYVDGLDEYRLRNNQQRVFALLLDGRWHMPEELRRVGGAAWDSRVRALRGPAFGGIVIDTQRDPRRSEDSGAWQYRMDLTTVTPEVRRRILEWDLEGNDGESALKTARLGLIRRVKGMTLDECRRLAAVLDGDALVAHPRHATLHDGARPGDQGTLGFTDAPMRRGQVVRGARR